MPDLPAAAHALQHMAFALGVVELADLPDTYEYSTVRATFIETLVEAFTNYAGGGARTGPRNAVGRALAEAIPDAFYRGLDDAGADGTEPEDEAWVTAKVSEQLGFVDGVFDWLKRERETETITIPAIEARAAGWAAMLDGVYSQGLLRGAGKQMLTWRLGQTEQHCRTCAHLNGQRHSAKWWLKYGYIPRQPGSQTLECGGWQCDCRLEDDQGTVVTIAG